jgi:hypothetical protein
MIRKHTAKVLAVLMALVAFAVALGNQSYWD